MDGWKNKALRDIPAIEQLIGMPQAAGLLEKYGRQETLTASRAVIAGLRAAILSTASEKDLPPLGEQLLVSQIKARLREQTSPSLKKTINATGVVLHTNLGRAPLARQACQAITEVASGYSNLEYELDTGRRGSRHSHLERVLCRLTGAEAAAVVNNNAAAVLLSLAALAAGREVIVARGQLVEIGGSFRIPEVMTASGCQLKEVGTTNKVHVHDYRQAIGPDTALLLKVHTSNYRISGFTSTVEGAELVALGRECGLPVLEDLGSGVLVDLGLIGLEKEPTVVESVASGVDVVTFSGDKLLGGPQAGIIAGKREYLDMIKRHPLARAVRVGKLTLAALEATLSLYLDPDKTWDQVPALRALGLNADQIKDRAQGLAELIGRFLPGSRLSVLPGSSEVGGGALPLTKIPTWLIALEAKDGALSADEITGRLRRGRPPVIARIAQDRVLFDLRTVAPEEEASLVEALVDAWRGR